MHVVSDASLLLKAQLTLRVAGQNANVEDKQYQAGQPSPVDQQRNAPGQANEPCIDQREKRRHNHRERRKRFAWQSERPKQQQLENGIACGASDWHRDRSVDGVTHALQCRRLCRRVKVVDLHQGKWDGQE